MARASLSLSMGVVAAAGVLVVLCATLPAAAQGKKGPPPPKLPSNYKTIHPGRFGKRYRVLTCDKIRCPNECVVICPSCKSRCICDLYHGVSCGDPRFTGADGNTFYFHGKKDKSFCIVSDADLHINAHFIGKRNPTMSRDFTWIQALGIRFADHILYMAAQKTVEWDSDVDRLELAFNGMPIDIPTEIDAEWQSTIVPMLTVTRTSATNGVRVQLKGVFEIMANVVPITEKDSRIHNYDVTEEDSLAHFDIGFKFYALTDDVDGVLGQTYRTDFVNKLSMSTNMPIMGGAANYVSSDIFSTDCKVARFRRGHDAISIVTTKAN